MHAWTDKRKGVAGSCGEEWMGWGLVGARLCVPASDNSPQETQTQKKTHCHSHESRNNT